MNINTAVMALNVNNMLVKKQLDKDQENKNVTSALKINEDINKEETGVKVENVETTKENLIAAESDVTNIVMVEDLLKRTKDSILQQSAMALLSQANKNSADVITLLQ